MIKYFASNTSIISFFWVYSKCEIRFFCNFSDHILRKKLIREVVKYAVEPTVANTLVWLVVHYQTSKLGGI
jgi:hypothetical protein